MARKSATLPKEPASLPDVLIPPSEAQANERSAYWLQLIENPQEFKAAVQTEDFWALLRDFPSGFWDRLSLYLYRREDDSGMSIKNAEGKKKYITVFHAPVDEEMLTRKCGGGKFTLYLKLDSKETLREYTFWLDGTPKVQPGQVVEIDGHPVPLGTPAPPSTQPSETAQIINANSEVAKANAELLKDGMRGVLEMQTELTRKELGLGRTEKDPLETAIRLLELIRPQAAPSNSMADALTLIDKLDAINARRNPTPVEKPETPLNETLETIKTLTGADSLADLMQKPARAAVPDPITAWAPIVSTAGQVALSFFDKLPNLFAQRTEQLRLELAIRQTGQIPPIPGQPARLPAAPVPPVAHAIFTQPPPAAPQPSAADPQALVGALVKTICDGFDKHRNTGSEIAAAMDVQFGEAIESLGIDRMLSVPAEIKTFIAGLPALAERSKLPGWPEFETDFLDYTTQRWGEQPDDEDDEAEKPGPQAVEGEKPAAS